MAKVSLFIEKKTPGKAWGSKKLSAWYKKTSANLIKKWATASL
jgi:hypothetical protein